MSRWLSQDRVVTPTSIGPISTDCTSPPSESGRDHVVYTSSPNLTPSNGPGGGRLCLSGDLNRFLLEQPAQASLHLVRLPDIHGCDLKTVPGTGHGPTPMDSL